MGNKQQKLTPFEQAEQNRKEGAQRLAGIVITQAWLTRMRQLRKAKQVMTPQERSEWDVLIINAAIAQHNRFGFDA